VHGQPGAQAIERELRRGEDGAHRAALRASCSRIAAISSRNAFFATLRTFVTGSSARISTRSGCLVAVVLLCVWVVVELRSTTPLVDVRAVRHPAVAGANVATFVGGIGMYLLLTLVTRYAQTPHDAGYGFGLTTFVAGLVLIPFSVLGFVAGKLTPRLRTRIADPVLLAGSAVVVGGGFALFAAARSNLAELFVAMGVLGFGVGGFSAAMPGVILAVTPKSETSSAMSVNYVVRSVGYSLGSAIGGLILAAGTGPGRLFPDDSAYTTAALIGIGAMAITTLTSLALASRRSSETP
jgi:MFS family permease